MTFQSFRSWATSKLPISHTAATLLLLSAACTAAWLPPQTRHALVARVAVAAHLISPATPLLSPVEGSALASQAGRVAVRPLLVSSKGRKRSNAAPAPNPAPGSRPTLVVNSTTDGDDYKPGDGICQSGSADGGAVCSLRAAIEEANASGGAVINFNIPGSGVQTIAPATQLPNITKPVTINGYSQPGSSANTLAVGDDAKILVELSGANAGAAGAGLVLTTGTDGSSISGVVINRFANGSGVIISGSKGNRVSGCFIGTDATGTAAAGNGFNGVAISGADGNSIGADFNSTFGSGSGQPGVDVRNVISGNGAGNQGQRPGVLLINGARNNSVRNNYIGTDATGTSSLGNGGSGVQIFSATADANPTSSNSVTNNLISGNTGIGLDIDGAGTTGTDVFGNNIGQDATKTKTVPNTTGGVQVSGASNNFIGVDNVTANSNHPGNIISGNGNSGVVLNAGAHGNFVSFNAIVGNTLNGVAITGAGDNDIGTNNGGFYSNLVSGNGIAGKVPGILITQTPVGMKPNRIANNRVGTDGSGTKALGNGGSGIQIFSGPNDSVGPSGTIVTNNLLSGNGLTGLDIDGPKTTGTVVTLNKIGTDVNGTVAIPNASAGVQILNSTGNTIGDVAPTQANHIGVGSGGLGNLIQFNTGGGVALSGTNNTLINNTVADNGNVGVLVSASNNLVQSNNIGNTKNTNAAGTFGSGILVGNGCTGTVIQSNTITSNAGNGILFYGAAPGHTVGDPLPASGSGSGGATAPVNTSNAGRTNSPLGNFITSNKLAGVSVQLATFNRCHRKSILGNSIGSNGTLSIDLGGSGTRLVNQPSGNQGDSTVGPNALQNYPILSGVTVSGSNDTVTGSLTSAPNATFRIEFYSYDEIYLGYQYVTTNGSGVAAFSTVVPFGPGLFGGPGGESVSATATDAVGNTSEFSPAVTGPAPTATATPTPAPIGTTTTITSSANPSAFLQTITLTAHVAPASGAGVPTGKVSFGDGSSTTIGPFNVDANGDARYTTGALSVGPHTFTAFFNPTFGTTTYAASSSAPFTQTVNAATTPTATPVPVPTATPVPVPTATPVPGAISTTTTLTSSLNPSTFGQTVTFTANAMAGAVNPSGTITFYDGGALIGTVTQSSDAITTFSTTALGVGTHSITASYGGNPAFGVPAKSFGPSTSAVLSQVVNAAPTPTATPSPAKVNTTTTLASSLNPSNVGQSVTLTATVSFTAPTVTPIPTSTPTPGTQFGNAKKPLKAKPRPVQAAPGGSVTFFDGATVLGTSPLGAGGVATFSTATLTPGTHPLTAVYSGDAAYNGGTSNIVSQVVIGTPVLTLTQSTSTPTVGIGGQAVFSVVVKNTGTGAAPAVVVFDTLPANATFVSATGGTLVQTGSTLTFTTGALAVGASQTLSVTVTAPATVGTLVNTVTASATGPTGTQTAPVPAQVQVTNGAAAFTFGIGKLIHIGPYTPSLYRPGGRFIQNVTITNTGTAAANTPLLLALDGLPSSVTIVNGVGTDSSGATLVRVPTSGAQFAIGQSVTVRLEFRLNRTDKPTFTPRIVTGVGSA